jgi:hypothetical protein
MPRDLNVIAIVAAHNEADIIHQTVGDLIQQGIGVYLLDHGSSDGTAAAVSSFLGHGLLAVETISSTTSPSGVDAFRLSTLLARKEELTRELKADWYINHDADEFRESPWAHLNFREGIELVDRLGYNAIDFALLNFWPTNDAFRPEDDIRESFHYYEAGAPWDRLQIRCWKRTDAAVDLVSSAGHEASFAGRRVFPIRFLLRHYPIRGQAHGTRKVFKERVPRFDDVERAKGWHVQYDNFSVEHNFLRRTDELSFYDADAVRVELHLGPIDNAAQIPDLDRTVATLGEQVATLDRRANEFLRQIDEQRQQLTTLTETLRDRTVQLEAERSRVQDVADKLATTAERAADLDTRLSEVRNDRDRLHGLVAALHASASWRITAPMRAAWRVLSGSRDAK